MNSTEQKKVSAHIHEYLRARENEALKLGAYVKGKVDYSRSDPEVVLTLHVANAHVIPTQVEDVHSLRDVRKALPQLYTDLLRRIDETVTGRA